MFEKRACGPELIDDLALDTPALAQNLRELESVNRWLGGRRTLISALEDIRRVHAASLATKRITIADLGCGGGDLLAAVRAWSRRRGLDADLVGLDANPFVLAYAAARTRGCAVRYERVDVLSNALDGFRFDIVCLNTVCHHFADAELARLLRRLNERTGTAIVVNDLHRHWLAYAAITALARVLRFSHLGRHDGPLSVLRAFRRHELVAIVEAAGITRYRIRWSWPFRWKLVVWTR